MSLGKSASEPIAQVCSKNYTYLYARWDIREPRVSAVYGSLFWMGFFVWGARCADFIGAPRRVASARLSWALTRICSIGNDPFIAICPIGCHEQYRAVGERLHDGTLARSSKRSSRHVAAVEIEDTECEYQRPIMVPASP